MDKVSIFVNQNNLFCNDIVQMDYLSDIWGIAKRNPETSGGVMFLMFLVFALSLTLGLVWSDYIYGWGLLRKKYPGESCKVRIGGVHNCLSGLNCTGAVAGQVSGLCTCPNAGAGAVVSGLGQIVSGLGQVVTGNQQ